MIERLRRTTTLVLGPFGSGKTEIALSLARELARAGESPFLVDLDIVTPYFRARDARSLLEEEGVRLVAPGGEIGVSELPALPPGIAGALRQGALGAATTLADVGGGIEGAHALMHLLPELAGGHTHGLIVLNRNRPEGSGEGLERFVVGLRKRRIPAELALSNTHLGWETSLPEWLEGLEWAHAEAARLGLDLVATGVPEPLAERASAQAAGLPLVVVTRVLRYPWEV